MESKQEKKSVPNINKGEIIEQKKDVLLSISQHQLDVAKRLNAKIENSNNLIRDVDQRTEKQTDRLENMGERVAVETARSSSCTLF